jgi:cold shock CspA family protein
MLQKVNEKPITVWETGTVKWFDRVRRFGFVFFDEADSGENEAFLRWTVLQESNIAETSLRQGTKVRFTWKPSVNAGGRPEVVRIALVDRRR